MLLTLKEWVYKTLIDNDIVYNYKQKKNTKLVQGKEKIFVIGRNKTGTTSITNEFKQRGYIIGHHNRAKLLLDDYKNGSFDPIIEFSKTAQVLSDFPFSYNDTYKYVDKAFPNSKFVLALRDSPDQWYNSMTKHHGKQFGSGSIPTKEDLQNSDYIYKGWIWDANRSLYDSPDDEPYQKKALIENYKKHNKEVIEYFKDSKNLLVINISEPDSYQKFCEFFGLDNLGRDNFLWSNKTSEKRKK